MGQLSNYKDFVLRLSKEAPNLYRASAMVNDSAAAAQTFELRTDELKVIESLRRIEEQAVRAQAKETFHTEFGRELYTKVFGGELGKYFKKCLEEAEKCGAGLRISLSMRMHKRLRRCHGNSSMIATSLARIEKP
jgi:hypothetical protein